MGGVVAGAAAMQAVAAEHDVLEQHLRGVPGWLSDEEATALYELAKGCTGRGVIVEIGSFKGRSTICLGLGSQAGQGVPIYAIDAGRHRGACEADRRHVGRRLPGLPRAGD
jgi:predicted O-methyltransferase YrrM